MNQKLTKITDHTTLLFSLISFIGAVFYMFFNLKTFNAYLILFIAVTSYLIIIQILKKVNKSANVTLKTNTKADNKTPSKYLLIIINLLLPISILFNFLILFNSRSENSIVSPWQTVPNYFFFFISFSTILLIASFFLKSRFNLFFIIIFYLLLNSVAIIIYKFGFGFDFLIHETTIELINSVGSVTPKPFYYLGQYSLVIILHKIFFIPIYYLHLLLVPVLASILIPINLYQTLKQKFSSQTNIYFTILILISLPIGLFFNTTPQNLAYLFLILIIIRGLNCRNYFDIVYIFSLALATLTIQVIAGIPAILLSLTITLYYSDLKKIKAHFYRLLFIFSAISLPLAFTILNKINHTKKINEPNVNIDIFKNIKEQILPQLPEKENIILNFIYFLSFNINFFLFILLAIGAYQVYKYKKEFQIYKIYLFLSLGFLVSFIITNNLSFNYLIDYERSAFASRIFIIALLLLTPFLMVSIFTLLDSLSYKKKSVQLSFLIFLIVLLPALLYLNYPRLDNYHNSHGYSVGQNDIDAVRYIENSTASDYIVLANQQTSVAALREFGFKKYYHTDNNQEIFYYPIPTGGPLYKHFLTMVNEKPTKKTMLEAMNLAKVNTGYFVINKYWWAFPKIIEEAKIEATSWKSINNGEIYIFKYMR